MSKFKFKKINKKACPAKLQRSGGFTLVEILVAVGLFVVIATFSLGAVVSIFDANKKAQASKTVVDNLNITIENMARTIRFGTKYHCGTGGSSLSEAKDCDDSGVDDAFFAVTFDGNIVTYNLCSTQIKRSGTGATSCSDTSTQAITSSDTTIDYLKFYVKGNLPFDDVQPYIKVVIKGHVGGKPSIQTNFSIETLISQRTLDLGL